MDPDHLVLDYWGRMIGLGCSLCCLHEAGRLAVGLELLEVDMDPDLAKLG